MTTPRGEAPLTETGPNGREQAKPAARGRRPKASAWRSSRRRRSRAQAHAAVAQPARAAHARRRRRRRRRREPRRAQAAEPRENLAEDRGAARGRRGGRRGGPRVWPARRFRPRPGRGCTAVSRPGRRAAAAGFAAERAQGRPAVSADRAGQIGGSAAEGGQALRRSGLARQPPVPDGAAGVSRPRVRARRLHRRSRPGGRGGRADALSRHPWSGRPWRRPTFSGPIPRP